ncbi:MAG: DUF3298 domain-containing protein [Acidimicrobiia bacterium]
MRLNEAAAVLALAAAACGGGATFTTATSSTTSTTAAPATTTTAAPTTTTVAAVTSTTTTVPPAMEVVTVVSDAGGGDLPYEIHLEIPQLVNHPVPAIEDAINVDLESAIAAAAADTIAYAGEIGDAEGKSTLDVQYAVTLFTPDLLSVRVVYFSYAAGAAHPASWVDAMIFDLASGRPVGPEDLLDPSTSPAAAANMIATAIADGYYDGTAYEVFSWAGGQSELLSVARFWLGEDVLGVSFDQYAVGPGALGPVQVQIPYTELAPLADRSGPLAGVPAMAAAWESSPSELLALRRDGLGLATFGEEAEVTVSRLETALGAPDTDSGWVDEDCEGMARTVSWGGLWVQLTTASTQWSDLGPHFSSYAYFAGGGGPSLATPEGIGFGDTVADLAAVYGPNVEFNAADTIFGPVFIAARGDLYRRIDGRISWLYDARPFWGNLEGVAPTDAVLSFYAGTDVCAGLI